MSMTTEADVDNEKAVPLDLEFLLGFKDRHGAGRSVLEIGDLAREFDVTLRSLRFYEDRGLLKPERRGTKRLYSQEDRKRLRIVLLGKALGFSLLECQELVRLYTGSDTQRHQLEVTLQRFEEQRLVLLDQQREIGKSLEAMESSIGVLKRRLGAMAK